MIFWIVISIGLCRACTYIDHGAYYKGSSSTLLYSKSGTIESCKAECSANPSCNGFGRMSGNCYFSSTIVPFSTTCSSCSYFTKDNCDTTTKTTTSTTTVKPTTTAMKTTPTTPLAATTPTTTPVAATTTPVEATTTPVAATTTPVAVTTPVAATTKTSTGTGSCFCPCVANTTVVKDKLAKPESLVLSKKDLSSYRKSRICIADNRPSAVALGSLGVAVLVACVLLVVLPDVFRFMRVIWNSDCFKKNH
uniref:Integumentary mucin C.1-like n=1 Tax=Crassostrea virginica TaxID=6565 RepID=A0A8B8BLM3_CRAVI|nr:integumentary mucin C.1-like [Crassostrea virginica]